VTAIQPALDGTVPQPAARRRVEDYEAWVAEVRPTFEEIAAAGTRFVSWRVKEQYRLPDPPDPAHDWGRLLGQLRHDGLLRYDGWSTTRDRSGVRAWRGTRAARREVTA